MQDVRELPARQNCRDCGLNVLIDETEGIPHFCDPAVVEFRERSDDRPSEQEIRELPQRLHRDIGEYPKRF